MEWIPVTERLPTCGDEVIVTLAPVRKGAKTKVSIGVYWGPKSEDLDADFGWSLGGEDIKQPLAWMPLPLPFNAGAVR